MQSKPLISVSLQNGQVLLVRRTTSDSLPRTQEFQEVGLKKSLDGLVRELAEEMGLRLTNPGFLGRSTQFRKKVKLRQFNYLVEPEEGDNCR